MKGPRVRWLEDEGYKMATEAVGIEEWPFVIKKVRALRGP
jgi:hypothetical protein